MQTRAARRRAAAAAITTDENLKAKTHPDHHNTVDHDHGVLVSHQYPALSSSPQTTVLDGEGTMQVHGVHQIEQAELTSDEPNYPQHLLTPPTEDTESVNGSWEYLPHIMGRIWRPHANTAPVINGEYSLEQSNNVDSRTNEDQTCETIGRSAHGFTKTEPDGATLQYQKQGKEAIKDLDETKAAQPSKQQRIIKRSADEAFLHDQSIVADSEKEKKSRKKSRKSKDNGNFLNKYGVTPGETPFPDWNYPSAEQCLEVYNILANLHKDVNPLPPAQIPAPSLEVAGCGEVPSILDALLRTVLSASTTFESADEMLKRLIQKFGVLQEGVGKGSVHWDKVRLAAFDEVYNELKSGGLGTVKAKTLQEILQMVNDDNIKRRTAYKMEKETGMKADVAGAAQKTEGQKELEILRTDQDMLSLDYLHDLGTYEVMNHFLQYPQVGVKTAACVLLFCLQRPCFAVDTHVRRMSRWLGWVPQKANADDTFKHLEVRCPDELKYGLHQLFIQHGKDCYRCNGKNSTGTKAWQDSECRLEHLINRFNKRIAKPKVGMKEERNKAQIEKELVDSQAVEKFAANNEDNIQLAGDNGKLDLEDRHSDDSSVLSEVDSIDMDDICVVGEGGNFGTEDYDSDDSSVLSELDESGIDAEMFEAMYRIEKAV
ncbi:hypothetical protein KJ359_009489 [Pestalotiopsis sp. 9143b]|nr:hypothetical protein KJ359_009489 [Pestalotiopsis sp. 9143b]